MSDEPPWSGCAPGDDMVQTESTLFTGVPDVTDAEHKLLTTRQGLPPAARALLVIGLLYLFLVGVRLLETGIKGLGSDFTDSLFSNVSNPLAGLFVGILATVLVQSSSVTTATIVGLVATGVLQVDTAVPMIMGANIGTTVTNTIVALTHMRHADEFRKAFTAATMHDWFNIFAVAVLLPLELMTGVISNAATALADLISGGRSLGGTFDSPVKEAVSFTASIVEEAFASVLGNEKATAVVLLIVAIGTIFVTLTFITKNMKVLVADRIERSLNAVLGKRGSAGILVGVVVTIAVQSSSITTSILIPLVASGVILVRNAYPITLGANIGTTITALLAALGAGSVDGLTIALVHTIFNAVAIALIWPIPKIRYLPVDVAERFSALAVERRSLALTYAIGMFIVIPTVGILIL